MEAETHSEPPRPVGRPSTYDASIHPERCMQLARDEGASKQPSEIATLLCLPENAEQLGRSIPGISRSAYAGKDLRASVVGARRKVGNEGRQI